MVIYDRGITFYHTIHCKIAPVASISDLTIFEYFDGNFYSIHGSASTAQDGHSSYRSIITRLKMKGFILWIVISCSRMHKYGSNITAAAASVSIEHGAVR